MKVLILNGSHANDPMETRVISALQSGISARGWNVETIVLRDKKIGNCAGDFFCWIKTPGICAINDDNREIAKKIMGSDLVINVGPIIFGGYASPLKRAMDHQIQNTSPFFTVIDGEIHHKKRYETHPNVITIGWLDAPNPNAEAIFRHLEYRNSLNMHSKVHWCEILYRNQPEDKIAGQINQLLTRAERLESDPVPSLPQPSLSTAPARPVRKALLLVGSPRMRKSTSASLGDYLFEQLKAKGVETETLCIYPYSAERNEKLYAMLAAADLIVLVFPLYIDSLPGHVVSVLEEIASHKAGKPGTRFAAIANCGFPEAHHNDNALAICAEFARTLEFEWLGSLSLGGGEMVQGVPLNELGGRAIPIKKPLDMAAEALSAGQPIPDNARSMLAKPVIPAWLYRIFGSFGWKQQAKQYGAKHRLMDQPYKQTS